VVVAKCVLPVLAAGSPTHLTGSVWKLSSVVDTITVNIQLTSRQ